MPSCVLRYCTNNSSNRSKCKGITFHRFPRLGRKDREKWIKFVQKNRSEVTWLPSSFSKICSVHFRDEDKYITKEGRHFLKKSAVPYEDASASSSRKRKADETDRSSGDIYDRSKEKACLESTEKADPDLYVFIEPSNSNGMGGLDIDDEDASESFIVPEISINSSETTDATEIDEETNLSGSELSCSDVDEALETPRQIMIRRELRIKSALVQRMRKRLASLHNKNKRLVNKVSSLKTIVKSLKQGKCCCLTEDYRKAVESNSEAESDTSKK